MTAIRIILATTLGTTSFLVPAAVLHSSAASWICWGFTMFTYALVSFLPDGD